MKNDVLKRLDGFFHGYGEGMSPKYYQYLGPSWGKGIINIKVLDKIRFGIEENSMSSHMFMSIITFRVGYEKNY